MANPQKPLAGQFAIPPSQVGRVPIATLKLSGENDNTTPVRLSAEAFDVHGKRVEQLSRVVLFSTEQIPHVCGNILTIGNDAWTCQRDKSHAGPHNVLLTSWRDSDWTTVNCGAEVLVSGRSLICTKAHDHDGPHVGPSLLSLSDGRVHVWVTVPAPIPTLNTKLESARHEQLSL